MKITEEEQDRMIEDLIHDGYTEDEAERRVEALLDEEE